MVFRRSRFTLPRFQEVLKGIQNCRTLFGIIQGRDVSLRRFIQFVGADQCVGVCSRRVRYVRFHVPERFFEAGIIVQLRKGACARIFELHAAKGTWRTDVKICHCGQSILWTPCQIVGLGQIDGLAYIDAAVLRLRRRLRELIESFVKTPEVS